MRKVASIIVTLMALSAKAGSTEQPLNKVVWNQAELGGFVDGVMEAQQKAQHFAGAVVVVVQEGRVVFQKGYGYADFAERKPVDPARTLFRIASNSKMFVWTAVMQLVERGLLDIHTDINRYLKGFQVPSAFYAREPDDTHGRFRGPCHRLVCRIAGFDSPVGGTDAPPDALPRLSPGPGGGIFQLWHDSGGPDR
jgi:CubicO group peptidase (beta-lactamase class C family)